VRRRRSGRRGSDKSEKEVAAVPASSRSKLIESEEAATGSVGAAVYWRYFKSIGLALGISAVLSNALNQAASVYSGSNYRLNETRWRIRAFEDGEKAEKASSVSFQDKSSKAFSNH
jgi:hypothetical protein